MSKRNTVVKKDWIRETLDLMSMTPQQQNDDLDDRMVARLDRKDNNGIGVSTVFTRDAGYETAILTDRAIPVERYETRKQAVAGHKKWVNKSQTLDGKTVTELGAPGFDSDEETVIKALI